MTRIVSVTFCGGGAAWLLLMSIAVWSEFVLGVFVFCLPPAAPARGGHFAARLTAKAAYPPMSRKITGANTRSVGPRVIPLYEAAPAARPNSCP